MKSAGISEIKKELNTLEHKQLQEILLRVAKYKKENKELIAYLLFDAGDEETYIENVKAEIDQLFTEINHSNWHLIKKTLRKILRLTNKYIKYSGAKQTEIELLVYYLNKMKGSGIHFRRNTVLVNLYTQQLNKIEKAMATLHEDLQFDYRNAVDELQL